MMTVLHICAELMLAACCALAAFSGWRQQSSLAALGFALIGGAALLGALAYAGVDGAPALHDGASFLAARTGLLLIAAQSLRRLPWALGVLLLAAANLFVPSPLDQGIAVLALAAIAWKGRSRHWPLAITGAALFALSGLVIGTRGEWLGIPRVDLFHLGLAAAVLAWWRAGLSEARPDARQNKVSTSLASR